MAPKSRLTFKQYASFPKEGSVLISLVIRLRLNGIEICELLTFDDLNHRSFDSVTVFIETDHTRRTFKTFRLCQLRLKFNAIGRTGAFDGIENKNIRIIP
jgi:hypothetical protein